ncbi:hypothetical protein TrispH2_010661 [Trichoplax sp. H2]|nr:hypothetical protein TrispH2_010661 [Trichoplax sp. H2]|eukprot:RDD37941.1 hypothetical protein TrispH2_010661 [Trichoplax sp. H2]
MRHFIWLVNALMDLMAMDFHVKILMNATTRSYVHCRIKYVLIQTDPITASVTSKQVTAAITNITARVKCQLACKNGGGYCRLDKKQKPYCLCPSGFVDRDCGTRKPVITSNIIAGMIIGFAALVIVIILVSVFYYLRWKSDKRNRQGYDEASTATLKSNPSSSKDTDRKSSTRLNINECNSSQSVCTLQHQICINTDGDFRCRCDQETTGISYHKNCTECNANCSNTTVCVVTNDDRAICRCIPGKEGICPIPPSFDFRTITGLITGGVAFVVIVCLLSIFCYLKRKSAAKLEDDKQEHKQKS